MTFDKYIHIWIILSQSRYGKFSHASCLSISCHLSLSSIVRYYGTEQVQGMVEHGKGIESQRCLPGENELQPSVSRC